MSEVGSMTIGKIYKRHRHDRRAYRMCRVIGRTERGWLIDCGDGSREEITAEEAEKMEEVRG